MTDLIVFSVKNNKYAIRIENIQRIIQAVELRKIPNAHRFIDGIMSYEDSVLKVLNLRAVVGLKIYLDELNTLFAQLKLSHTRWVEELNTAITTGSEFTETFNPHLCDLGKWIDEFTSYDDNVSMILAKLTKYHKQLHIRGEEVFKMSVSNKEKAKEVLDNEINDIYKNTTQALDMFVLELEIVSNSLQKLLIYENKGEKFAIKVDKIEDIAHVEESELIDSGNEDDNSEFLELEGVLDLNGVLVNVIKTVNLPK